jgi:hypothetical protein
MKYFITTLLSGCLAVMLFIWWADPANRGRRKQSPLNRPLQNGEVWLHTDNFDEREMRLAQMRMLPKFQTVILGSSRSLMIGIRAHQHNSNNYNFGASGGGLADFAAFWQALLLENKRPEKIFLFIDPWMLNRDFGASILNSDTLLPLYFAFLQRTGGSNKSLDSVSFSKRFELSVTTHWRAFEEYLSWPNLKTSFIYLYSRRMSDPQLHSKITITTEKQAPTNASGTRWDGTRVYPAKEKYASVEKVRQHAPKLVADSITTGWVPTAAAIELLHRLVDDISAKGTKLIIISTPFPIATYQLIEKEPSLSKEIREVFNVFRSLSEKSKFCNATNPIDVGCTDEEFSDALHMKESCAEKLIKFCKHII